MRCFMCSTDMVAANFTNSQLKKRADQRKCKTCAAAREGVGVAPPPTDRSASGGALAPPNLSAEGETTKAKS